MRVLTAREWAEQARQAWQEGDRNKVAEMFLKYQRLISSEYAQKAVGVSNQVFYKAIQNYLETAKQ